MTVLTNPYSPLLQRIIEQRRLRSCKPQNSWGAEIWNRLLPPQYSAVAVDAVRPGSN